MSQRQAGEGAADVRVGVRRALAGEVGREEQALGSRRPVRRSGIELGQVGGERVPQPGRGARGAEHDPHRVPRPGDRVAEHVHARLGIRLVAGQDGEDDAGRAEHDRGGAGRGDPDAEGGSRLVAGAADLGRLERRRQPLARDPERLAHLLRPAAVRDVEEERSRSVCGVDRPLAGEAQPDVVLRQQDVANPGVRLGLVPAKPQELRRREARQRPVAGQRDQPVEADEPFDLCALRSRALVVPEDRRADDTVVGIQRDQAVHLARQADRPVRQPRQAGLRGAPPVVGILLGPARLGRRERVRLLGARDQFAVGGDRDALDAGRADVEPDQCPAPAAAEPPPALLAALSA